MADTDQRAATPTGVWVGPIVFAGVMMIILGFFHGFQGFVALFNDGFYAVRENGLAVHIDYTAWAWTHLIVGTIVLVAGFCVLLGQVWARVVGVIVAVLSIVVSAGFLSAAPGWSTIMIALGILVIWALTFHGREVRPEGGTGGLP
ncbi:DUF7144 family membrane protein [Kribbella sp. NBC_00359]|uniref:DUF7144 family membrane protein n=1 Tax=Kribbella sp. NBC_00359 TaxID=2975966 RepID=UPI002E249777